MVIKLERFQALPRTAKRQEKPLAAIIQPVLDEQIRQFGKALEEAGKSPNIQAILAVLSPQWEKQLIEAKGDGPLKMAVHGYKMTAAWMGRKSYLDDLLAKATTSGDLDIDVDLWGTDEATAIHLRPEVGQWVADTSHIETQTSSKKLEQAFHDAFGTFGGDDNLDIVGLAKEMVSQGLAWDKARGLLMARTMSNWAYNEGAMQNYEDYGITTKEWLTTVDDAACDLCVPMNGKRNGIRENYLNEGQYFEGNNGAEMVAEFDIKHPPLHPNCRCCLIPVIPGF